MPKYLTILSKRYNFKFKIMLSNIWKLKTNKLKSISAIKGSKVYIF
jgi:hypothetical protein